MAETQPVTTPLQQVNNHNMHSRTKCGWVEQHEGEQGKEKENKQSGAGVGCHGPGYDDWVIARENGECENA